MCSDSRRFSSQVEETDEARKKFSNAKAISSSQFFGTQNREEKEAQLSLQKFAVGLLLRHSRFKLNYLLEKKNEILFLQDTSLMALGACMQYLDNPFPEACFLLKFHLL
jgi:hypothetical protein